MGSHLAVGSPRVSSARRVATAVAEASSGTFDGTGVQAIGTRLAPSRRRSGTQPGMVTYAREHARTSTVAMARLTAASRLCRNGQRTQGKATSWNITRTSSRRRTLRIKAHATKGRFIAFQPNAWGTYWIKIVRGPGKRSSLRSMRASPAGPNLPATRCTHTPPGKATASGSSPVDQT